MKNLGRLFLVVILLVACGQDAGEDRGSAAIGICAAERELPGSDLAEAAAAAEGACPHEAARAIELRYENFLSAGASEIEDAGAGIEVGGSTKPARSRWRLGM